MHKLTGPGDKKGKIQNKKMRIKLLKEHLNKWQDIDNVFIQAVTGKSMFGKYGGALDFINAGGEIYLIGLDYNDGTITHAEFEFRMQKTILTSFATIGTGLGLATGASLGRFGGIAGIIFGAAAGGLVDVAFYLSAEGEKWLNKWGNYVRNQALNSSRSW